MKKLWDGNDTVSSKPHNKSGHPAQQTRGYAAHREAAAKVGNAEIATATKENIMYLFDFMANIIPNGASAEFVQSFQFFAPGCRDGSGLKSVGEYGIMLAFFG